jgi:hypothetical protein
LPRRLPGQLSRQRNKGDCSRQNLRGQLQRLVIYTFFLYVSSEILCSVSKLFLFMSNFHLESKASLGAGRYPSFYSDSLLSLPILFLRKAGGDSCSIAPHHSFTTLILDQSLPNRGFLAVDFVFVTKHSSNCQPVFLLFITKHFLFPVSLPLFFLTIGNPASSI